jgi:nicotinamidase-related amidase
MAAAIAPGIAKLKLRARHAGVPVIYANDNAGRWRSDFRSLIAESLSASDRGKAITELLMPDTKTISSSSRSNLPSSEHPLSCCCSTWVRNA